MSTLKRFEDIHAWQEGRKLASMVYDATKGGSLAKDFGLKDQLQRAAVSVASNIAEGFARSGNKEFLNYLWIARGSAAEVQSQLYTAKDIGYITDQLFELIYNQAASASILIYKLIQSIKASNFKGPRYATP